MTNLNQLVAAIELFQGIIFGVAAFVLYQRKKAKLDVSYKTEGEVIAVKEKPGSEGVTRHPVIRYKTMSGEELTFESRFGGSNWRVKVGDRLGILVSRTNPAEAEVDLFMAKWGLSLPFAFISLAGFISVPIVYLLLK